MTAAEIAKTRRELEIQLMEASGDAAGALAAQARRRAGRARPEPAPLLQLIYAAEDAARRGRAERRDQTAAEMAKSRHDLEIR
jgi:uncharacterized protein HemY